MWVWNRRSDDANFFFAVFGCLLLFQANAQHLTLTDYKQVVNFNGKKVVLICKGDDPQYKEAAFADSSWTVTSLPSEWKPLFGSYNGICWYRLHFVLPDWLPRQSLGISLGTICDADELYLNGELIGRSGSLTPPLVSAYDKIRLYELPTPLLKPGKDNVLALRIRGLFDYTNGPFIGNMEIDSYRNLLADYYSRELFDLIFIVVYAVFGVYFLIFFSRRKQDKSNLMFGLLTLLISIYLFCRTQLKYLFNIPFFWTKKIEYLILPWFLFLMLEFLILYYKKKRSPMHWLFPGVGVCFFLLILFSADYTLWDNLNRYLMTPYWFAGAGLGFYLILSKVKSDKDARGMFISLLILFSSLVNDILVNLLVYKFIRLTNYGFFFVIGSIAVILSSRFFRLHNEVEDLNKNLEQKVLTRTDELNRTVQELNKAQEETGNILLNVQEGIFLIDKDFCIGRQYSRIMEEIFEKKDLGGISLPGLLKEITAPEVTSQAQDFLTIVFSRNLPDKRLAQLNPLEEVNVVIIKDNKRQEKFLNFAFAKITDQQHNVFVLATVRDITERKRLAIKIRKTEEQAEKESSLFMEILHLNPQLLQNFLKEAQLEIRYMEDLLQKARFSADLKELLKNIYTSVHSLKGDAGMLAISSLASVTHQFENTIRDLYNKPDIKAVELIDLPYSLSGVKNILLRIEKMIEKITQFKSSFGHGILSDEEYLTESIRNTAARVAQREKKSVTVDIKYFHLPPDLGAKFLPIKKILLQLVKNAVVHGIELPAAREQKGKSATGYITVVSEIIEKKLIIKVTDDGGTLNPESIGQAALISGKYSGDELANLDANALSLLIFETGISTRSHEVTIDAGRGIGLDVVREIVLALDGKITLAFTAGAYTQFRVTLPLAAICTEQEAN